MTQPISTGRLSRRRLLQGVAYIGGAAAGGWILEACSSGSGALGSASLGTGASPGTPKRGGTLRLACAGTSPASLDPVAAIGAADYTVLHNTVESLVRVVGADFQLQLADTLEPNSDATMWTVRLRPGVTFHSGRPVSADDVIASMQRIISSQTSIVALYFIDVDAKNIRKIDDRTVQIPLHRPRADFIEGVLSQFSFVYPAGTTDFSKDYGSGPFILQSYQAGFSAALVANPNYWGGAPYLDRIEIQTIGDPTARLNALKAGSIDYAHDISPADAQAERSNHSIVIAPQGAAASYWGGFVMNTEKPPFDNPDVRRAFRLAIDRQAIVNTVLFGEGTIGNDLVGKGFPGYNDSIPQTAHDPNEARQLFAKAGVSQVILRAADIEPGLVNAAQVYAQQLARVGVTVKINEVPADTFASDLSLLSSTPFQTFGISNATPSAWLTSATGPRAWVPLGSLNTPGYDTLLNNAEAAVDANQRRALFNQVQAQYHDQGGLIIWGYAPHIEATRPNVHGYFLALSEFPVLNKAWIA